ncbi:MAG: type II toxin-antitoxin system PemK/MazF family toxin [Alphaproteobacteria bacterium]
MVKKFDVFFCEVRGVEKPCVIISPDEMNEVLPYVLVAPITSAVHPFPCRVGVKLKGQAGQVALDLIRSVSKTHLTKRLGNLPPSLQEKILELLKELFVGR